MKADPMGERRNAFHVFLFAVAAMNGVLLLVGVPTSGAIDVELNENWQRAYGGVLAIGALCVLVGMYWPADARDGLLVKRFGYVALCVATLVYSVAVFVTQPGPRGILAASVTVAFSAICGWTVHRINKRVNAVITITERVNGNGD
jgi:hypothetical protein